MCSHAARGVATAVAVGGLQRVVAGAESAVVAEAEVAVVDRRPIARLRYQLVLDRGNGPLWAATGPARDLAEYHKVSVEVHDPAAAPVGPATFQAGPAASATGPVVGIVQESATGLAAAIGQ
jgi:hypothetical protein